MASTAAAGAARPHDAPLTCHIPFTTRHTSSSSPALLLTVALFPSSSSGAPIAAAMVHLRRLRPHLPLAGASRGRLAAAVTAPAPERPHTSIITKAYGNKCAAPH
ncbi:hypothetical protein ZWY2020_054159 [Hordeum vulgare]|nr:hypothetical protein ZWY2020_054159 [Hordeum vulgare]